jgi:hypothetical protein
MKKRDRRKAPEVPTVTISAPDVNLVAGPVKIEPAATLGIQPLFLGSPIMREDFITSTGPLVSPGK